MYVVPFFFHPYSHFAAYLNKLQGLHWIPNHILKMISRIRMSTLRTLDTCQTTVQTPNTIHVFAHVKMCCASFFRSMAFRYCAAASLLHRLKLSDKGGGGVPSGDCCLNFLPSYKIQSKVKAGGGLTVVNPHNCVLVLLLFDWNVFRICIWEQLGFRHTARTAALRSWPLWKWETEAVLLAGYFLLLLFSIPQLTLLSGLVFFFWLPLLELVQMKIWWYNWLSK